MLVVQDWKNQIPIAIHITQWGGGVAEVITCRHSEHENIGSNAVEVDLRARWKSGSTIDDHPLTRLKALSGGR